MNSTTSTSFARAAPVAPGFSLPRLHQRLVFASVLVLVGTCTLEGPLRLVLVRLHAEFLLYIRDALALTTIATYFFTSLSFSRLKLGLCALIFALLASAVYSKVLGTQLAAIAMGLKVFSPVFLGVVFAQLLYDDDRLPVWPAVLGLLLTVAGLQWSALHPTPWSGLDYKAAGLAVEGTRSWTIEGIDRLAGFARSSGDAANLILLFYAAAVLGRRHWLLWLGLTAAAAYGLQLTTMRSALLGLVLVALVSLLLRVPRTGWLVRAGVLLTMLTAVAAPWVGRLLIKGDAPASGEGLASSGSMVMRLHEVWPDLLARFRSPLDFFLGLGLGNVGVPQKLFNPDRYNPADNMGLYALAVFGAASFLFHLLLARRVAVSAHPASVRAEALFLGLTGMVYAVGLAMNGFESIPLGLAIGLMCGLAFRSQANDGEAGHG